MDKPLTIASLQAHGVSQFWSIAVASEKAIGPAIILESCRWIASGLTKSLATSSDDADVQHAGGRQKKNEGPSDYYKLDSRK